jgi:hypothetical protein
MKYSQERLPQLLGLHLTLFGEPMLRILAKYLDPYLGAVDTTPNWHSATRCDAFMRPHRRVGLTARATAFLHAPPSLRVPAYLSAYPSRARSPRICSHKALNFNQTSPNL